MIKVDINNIIKYGCRIKIIFLDFLFVNTSLPNPLFITFALLHYVKQKPTPFNQKLQNCQTKSQLQQNRLKSFNYLISATRYDCGRELFSSPGRSNILKSPSPSLFSVCPAHLTSARFIFSYSSISPSLQVMDLQEKLMSMFRRKFREQVRVRNFVLNLGQ